MTGKVKGPWSDATVGSFVKMKSFTGALVTMKVVQVDDRRVVIEMTTERPGVPGFRSPPPQRITRPRYLRRSRRDEDPVVPRNATKLGDETIMIAGRKLLCQVFETKVKIRDRTITTRTYTCRDVPGWTVRIDNDNFGKMRTVTEVVDFKK